MTFSWSVGSKRLSDIWKEEGMRRL